MQQIPTEPAPGLEQEQALRLWGPQLDLWRAILTADADAFDARLGEALDHHAAFWNRDVRFNAGGRPLRDHLEGMSSLVLTAIVQVARNQGLPAHSASPYLVTSLLR